MNKTRSKNLKNDIENNPDPVNIPVSLQGVDPRKMTPQQSLLINLYRLRPRYDYVKLLLIDGLNPNFFYKEEEYKTPLMIAVENDKGKLIEMLIEHGADVNLMGENGEKSPLMIAVENDKGKLIEMLIEHGADVNLMGENGEKSPLMIAIENGKGELAEMLIDHGSDVNLMGKNGEKSPLMIAIENDKGELAEMLIDHGSDVNLANAYGNTPLYIAINQSKQVCVEILLKNKADPNSKTPDGDSIMDYTSQMYDIDIIQLLIEYGADVSDPVILRNLYNYIGSENDISHIVRLCLERGAKFVPNEEGKMPYEYGSLQLFQNLRDDIGISYDCSDREKKPTSYYKIIQKIRPITNSNIELLRKFHEKKSINSGINSKTVESILGEHRKYVKEASPRDRYILQQYTFNGDKMVNSLLLNMDESLLQYRELIFDVDRSRFIEYDYSVCPFLYALLDWGIVQCVRTKYSLFFFEEHIRPMIYDIMDLTWFQQFMYYYFIDLYKTIQQFPKADNFVTFYRGVKKNYLPGVKGKLFHLHNFQSSSHTSETAERYGPIKYIFYVHPACEYAYIEDISVNRGEEEVIINAFSRYIVLDYNTDQTVWKVGVLPPDITMNSLEELLKRRNETNIPIYQGGSMKVCRTLRRNRNPSRLLNWRFTIPILPKEIRDATPEELACFQNITIE